MLEWWIEFDTRLTRGPLQEAWTTTRRSTFLLTDEVVVPLSIDQDVWPHSPTGTPVGITVVVTDPDSPLAVRWRRPALPKGVQPVLLGYDVADVHFTSGLSNCGYLGEEREWLRSKWGRDLNEHHLFRESTRALEFVAVTDKRVPEHAPFLVFGVYLLAATFSSVALQPDLTPT
jgi:hypothetical protein